MTHYIQHVMSKNTGPIYSYPTLFKSFCDFLQTNKCGPKQSPCGRITEAHHFWSHHPRCHHQGVLRQSGNLLLWTRWSDWCRRRLAAWLLVPADAVAPFPTADQSGTCWCQRWCHWLDWSVSALNTEPRTCLCFFAAARLNGTCTDTYYACTQRPMNTHTHHVSTKFNKHSHTHMQARTQAHSGQHILYIRSQICEIKYCKHR